MYSHKKSPATSKLNISKLLWTCPNCSSYTATAIHLSYGEHTFNTIAGIQDSIESVFLTSWIPLLTELIYANYMRLLCSDWSTFVSLSLISFVFEYITWISSRLVLNVPFLSAVMKNSHSIVVVTWGRHFILPHVVYCLSSYGKAF